MDVLVLHAQQRKLPRFQWARRNIDSSTLCWAGWHPDPDRSGCQPESGTHNQTCKNDWKCDRGWHICQDATGRLAVTSVTSEQQENHNSCWIFWQAVKDERLGAPEEEEKEEEEKKKDSGCSLKNWVIEGRYRHDCHLHVSAMEKNVTDSLLRHFTGVSGAL